MEYEELEPALGADREGLFSPAGDVEAVPLREDDGRTYRIGLRRDRRICAVLGTPWRQTVALAFSSDGERLAAAGAPSGVCVWEMKTGALLMRMTAPRPWKTGKKLCLPLLFAPGDHILLVGGDQLSVVNCANWSITPVADFPVVAIVPDLTHHCEVRIVGPEENGAFPVEALDVETFTMSARGIVLREHHSSTSVFLGIG